MCYVKLIKGLRDQGIDVEVLAIEPDSFDAPGENLIDHSLKQLVPPGITMHWVRSWENNPAIRAIKRFAWTRSIFRALVEPRKNEWTFPARTYLDKLDLKGFDLILTCSQPHCNHLLGHYLKQRTGKPWIAYFSDPWTDNIYSDYRSASILRYHRTLEEKVIGTADAVFFTSPEILDLVMTKYPAALRSKCGVLTHSFVPEWYGGHAGADTPASGDSKLRIVQTGHVYVP